MSATRQPFKIVFTLGALLWASASLSNPLLPSQEEPNFFNVRICRDRQVLSALKTAAASTLRTKVIIANGSGADWSGYEPDDIHLEAVSLSLNKNEVFCSVSISAKGIIERIVYVVSTTSDSWVVRFGGTTGSELDDAPLISTGIIALKCLCGPMALLSQPAVFGCDVTLHTGPDRQAYVLLPIIPKA